MAKTSTHPFFDVLQRATVQVASESGPMKLSRDISRLASGADPRQCTQVGQLVLRGLANAGSPLCGNGVFTGCRFNCTARDIPSATFFNDVISSIIPAAEELFAALIHLRNPPVNDTLFLDPTYYSAISICDYDVNIDPDFRVGFTGIPNSHFRSFCFFCRFVHFDELKLN
jgi:hypothetical protein